eukprot:jgi/Bigna1/82159/fgenesh1_pg.88_\
MVLSDSGESGRIATANVDSHGVLSFDNIGEGSISLKRLDLARRSVRTIPEGTLEKFPDLVSLNMSENLLSMLPASLFRYNEHLKHISFDGNKISSLNKHMFQWLKKLRSVRIDRNFILEIPPTLFAECSNLREPMPAPATVMMVRMAVLSASCNQLTHLDPGLFGRTPKLEIVDVSGNSLQRISPELFRDAKDLQDFYLDNNQIETLESSLSGLTKLERFSAKNNLLAHSSDCAFSRLHHLKVVVLDFKPEYNNRLGTVTAFFERNHAAVKFPGPTRSVSIPVSCLRNVNQPPPGVQVLSKWMAIFRMAIGNSRVRVRSRLESGKWCTAIVDGIFLGMHEESTQYVVRTPETNATIRLGRDRVRLSQNDENEEGGGACHGSSGQNVPKLFDWISTPPLLPGTLRPPCDHAAVRYAKMSSDGAISSGKGKTNYNVLRNGRTYMMQGHGMAFFNGTGDQEEEGEGGGPHMPHFDENFNHLFNTLYPNIVPLPEEKKLDLKLQTASELLVWSILDRIVVSSTNVQVEPIRSIKVESIMTLAPFPLLRQKIISEFVALGFNQNPELTMIIVPQDRGFLQKLDERRLSLKAKFDRVTQIMRRETAAAST